jgi:DNA-binding response OmpR family regulator
VHVVVVDDEVPFAETLSQLVVSEGYTCETFYSLESAKAGLEGREDIFLVLLDHDFATGANETAVGYDLARWLKKSHWAQHVVPIIYVTGREVPMGYVRMRREFGGLAPDEYISKDELASDPDLLPTRLKHFDERLSNFEATIDERGLELALLIYGGMSL